MKTKLQPVAALTLLSSVILQPSALLAQGSLTPPGPPAPTMKTLQQVEPRVPISSAPFTISQPGSYYLTTNLTVSGGDAITIATNGVTLDLNGFTISSTANPASGVGVVINGGLRNIVIANGIIAGGVTNNQRTFSGPGFASGVLSLEPRAPNVRVSELMVSGCASYGINLGSTNSALAESCVVSCIGGTTGAGNGIIAGTVDRCVATECAGTAIEARTVANSHAESVGSPIGAKGISAVVVQNSYGYSYHGPGITAATAVNCYGMTDDGGFAGIDASCAENCFGNAYTGNYGIYSKLALNSYGVVSTGNYGLYADVGQGCYGANSTAGMTALRANHVAIGCVGNAAVPGTAVWAMIGNSCRAQNGTNNITYKYNMP